MDGACFDALTRALQSVRSRRQAVGLALTVLVTGVGEGEANHRNRQREQRQRKRARRRRVRPPRRRNSCQVRCGGERRMCRIRCRRLGPFARDCGRVCKVLRKSCHGRCRYHPVRNRFAHG